jgi:hypothetical protein
MFFPGGFFAHHAEVVRGGWAAGAAGSGSGKDAAGTAGERPAPGCLMSQCQPQGMLLSHWLCCVLWLIITETDLGAAPSLGFCLDRKNV